MVQLMSSDEEYVPYVPVKQRQLEKLQQYARKRKVEVDEQPLEEHKEKSSLFGPDERN